MHGRPCWGLCPAGECEGAPIFKYLLRLLLLLLLLMFPERGGVETDRSELSALRFRARLGAGRRPNGRRLRLGRLLLRVPLRRTRLLLAVRLPRRPNT